MGIPGCAQNPSPLTLAHFHLLLPQYHAQEILYPVCEIGLACDLYFKFPFGENRSSTQSCLLA